MYVNFKNGMKNWRKYPPNGGQLFIRDYMYIGLIAVYFHGHYLY